MKKAVQTFSEDYLRPCQDMAPDEITQFLDDFRRIHSTQDLQVPSTLISMQVPNDLLNNFKTKSKLLNIPNQSQIKILMRKRLES
jgi:hypothetical protein